MSGCMHAIAAVRAKIEQGKFVLLAGDEHLLRQLPLGNWIGGSIPHYMTERELHTAGDMIHVTELPDDASSVVIQEYTLEAIPQVHADAARTGFSIIIIPASSPTHLEFALNAPHYQGFGIRPLVGWVSGVHIEDLGKATAKVFNGRTGAVLEDGAVVMHVSLPPEHVADVGILNIFEQSDGDTIVFPEDGFSAQDVLVNGERTNLARYVRDRELDTRLPLVADYGGAMINVSFQSVDLERDKVNFYAPVFAGVTYKHAKPVYDYVEQFTSRMPNRLDERIVFSCNCILNYVYSGLSEEQADGVTGPMTFGEVAYQLLNQTMVYLTIGDVSAR